ncbi:hypothetical protein [Brucella sp. 2716]|uniref:hypothetical protein n=1 Tax=Brucella sp. 2716 TaxID=2975052 RepID=UPI00217D53B2|nr:hypothetical protein [Brucella sp. 2716]UWF59813.1 hypothetical protein NYO66_04690 [Brucella sp. 2716]
MIGFEPGYEARVVADDVRFKFPDYLLKAALDASYAAKDHTHTADQISGLEGQLTGYLKKTEASGIYLPKSVAASTYAPSEHTHAISQVEGLREELNGKLPSSGGTITGQLMGMNASTAEDSSASFVADSAGGAYVSVPKRRVPFKAQTTTIGNSYAPVLNVTYNTSAWAGVWSQGVINNGNNAQPTSYQIIHMHPDGSAQKFWTFDGVNGNFLSNGPIYAGGHVYAGGGSSRLDANGNIVGSIWNNFGASDAYTAINNRIENRAVAWANDRVAALAFRRVSHWAVAVVDAVTAYDAPTGAVIYGITAWTGYKLSSIKFCYLQAYDPVRGWITFWG